MKRLIPIRHDIPSQQSEFEYEVSKRKWFHCIPMRGIVTKGWREADAWQQYGLPESMEGKCVLDIGSWEGQFAFESERRGAKDIIALDLWDTDDAGTAGLGWDNFCFAHTALKSKVKPFCGSIYDMGELGMFDVITCFQVLYHLQHPLLGLQSLRKSCPSGTVYLETWIDAEWIDAPAAMFYEKDELAGDPTNWWGPNIKCVEAMARAAGFSECKISWSRQDGHFNGRGKRACFHLT